MKCFTISSDMFAINARQEFITVTRSPYPFVDLAGQRRVSIGRRDERQIVQEINGVEFINDVGFMPLKEGDTIKGHMIVAPLPDRRPPCDRALVLWHAQINSWKPDHTLRVRKDLGSDAVSVIDVGSQYVSDQQKDPHLLFKALTVLRAGDMMVLWMESQRYPRALKYLGHGKFDLVSDPYDEWELEPEIE
jgi:hypothetical protein